MEKKGSIFIPSVGATVPLRIRDKNGTVVGEGVSGKNIDVAEGCYHIGAILADGYEILLDQLVNVVAGETVSAHAVPLERSHLSAAPSAGELITEALAARRWRGDWLASFTAQSAPLHPDEDGFRADTVALQANGSTVLERDFEMDDLLIVDHGGSRSFHVLPLDRCLFGSGSTGENGAIGVELKPAGERLKLKYSSPVDPATNAFLEYVDNALLSESRAISADFIERSQHAMRSERASLLCAVLSAYVLLRANQLDGLDRWTQQLLELTPDMPDAYALHAETLARMGIHDRAVEALRGGLDKGCPWFRSGLSYSLERLRLYIDVHGGQSAFTLSEEDLEKFQLRKTQIERSAIRLDTTALFTTFHGAAQ